MRIVVCGGRDYADHGRMLAVLRGYEDMNPIIIHGASPGADRLAGRVAKQLGYPSWPFPADWTAGKYAGPERNRRMLDIVPDVVIAFPGGKGTADCVAEAERRGIPVRRVDHCPVRA